MGDIRFMNIDWLQSFCAEIYKAINNLKTLTG